MQQDILVGGDVESIIKFPQSASEKIKLAIRSWK